MNRVQTASVMTAATDPVAQAVLSIVQEADLVRQADGYTVAVWYRPNLRHAERATVEVYRGSEAIDAMDVPAAVALDVWRHAAAYSTAYAEVLTAD